MRDDDQSLAALDLCSKKSSALSEGERVVSRPSISGVKGGASVMTWHGLGADLPPRLGGSSAPYRDRAHGAPSQTPLEILAKGEG